MYVYMRACTHACMHEWMDVWMYDDVWMYGCVHALVYSCKYGFMCASTDVWMYGCMDVWMLDVWMLDVWTDGRMGGWMDGWTDAVQYVCI